MLTFHNLEACVIVSVLHGVAGYLLCHGVSCHWFHPQRRHCILPSSLSLLHSLTNVAPPISVLIKARHPESIR